MPTVDEGRPETLVSYTMRRLKTRIAEGAYPPGARLSPTAIASDLGVSHIPVREALRSLSARGFIEHRQSQGFFTRTLSVEELDEIYRLRNLLETECYRQAAPNLTDEDIEELIRLIDEMGKYTAREHRLHYLELNREYHFKMFSKSGSDVLVRLIAFLWDLAAPYSTELIDSSEGQRDHERQKEVLKTRDSEAIAEAMNSHREVRKEQLHQWASKSTSATA